VRCCPLTVWPLAPTAQSPPGNLAMASSTAGVCRIGLLMVLQLLPFQ
jgi:hypothetical protein